MDTIQKSGLFLPNKIAKVILDSLEESLGKQGLEKILLSANLAELVDVRPADDMERSFDFSDFSMLNAAIDEVYGARGGRAITSRAGKTVFDQVLAHFGAMAGVEDDAFMELPVDVKLRIGLPALAKILSSISDMQTTFDEKDGNSIVTVHNCPVCWGRQTEKPSCNLLAGLLLAGSKWISGGINYTIHQTDAKSYGSENCKFDICKE